MDRIFKYKNEYLIVAVLILFSLYRRGISDVSWCLLGLCSIVGTLVCARKCFPFRTIIAFASIFAVCILSFVLNGAQIESLSATMKPLILAFTVLYLYNLKKLDIAFTLCTAGYILLIISLLPIREMWDSGRLSGVFEYANAMGIFLAVCAFMIRTSDMKYGMFLALPIELGLYLTLSLGSMLLYIAAWIIWLIVHKEKRLALAVMIGVILLGALLVIARNPGRVVSSVLDRAIQISDGFRTMLHHPFGIGPGLWRYRVFELQSAYYVALRQHSFIAEIAAETGWIGMCTLIAIFVRPLCRIFKKGLKRIFAEPRNIAALMLCLHAAVDVTFSFVPLVVLLLILVVKPHGAEETYASCKKPLRVVSTVSFIAFGFITVLVSNAAMPVDYSKVTTENVIENFQDVKLKTSQRYFEYANALMANAKYSEAADATIEGYKRSPYQPDSYSFALQLAEVLPPEHKKAYTEKIDGIKENAENNENKLYKYLEYFKYLKR